MRSFCGNQAVWRNRIGMRHNADIQKIQVGRPAFELMGPPVISQNRRRVRRRRIDGIAVGTQQEIVKEPRLADRELVDHRKIDRIVDLYLRSARDDDLFAIRRSKDRPQPDSACVGEDHLLRVGYGVVRAKRSVGHTFPQQHPRAVRRKRELGNVVGERAAGCHGPRRNKEGIIRGIPDGQGIETIDRRYAALSAQHRQASVGQYPDFKRGKSCGADLYRREPFDHLHIKRIDQINVARLCAHINRALIGRLIAHKCAGHGNALNQLLRIRIENIHPVHKRADGKEAARRLVVDNPALRSKRQEAVVPLCVGANIRCAEGSMHDPGDSPQKSRRAKAAGHQRNLRLR